MDMIKFNELQLELKKNYAAKAALEAAGVDCPSNIAEAITSIEAQLASQKSAVIGTKLISFLTASAEQIATAVGNELANGERVIIGIAAVKSENGELTFEVTSTKKRAEGTAAGGERSSNVEITYVKKDGSTQVFPSYAAMLKQLIADGVTPEPKTWTGLNSRREILSLTKNEKIPGTYTVREVEKADKTAADKTAAEPSAPAAPAATADADEEE